MKYQFETAVAKPTVDVSVACLRLPRPLIPHHYGSTAVLSGWDDSLEPSILHRVIFHLNGQALVGSDVAWSLGDGPTLQYTIPSESVVIVQMRGRMLLDAEGKSLLTHFAF